jgi:hypothetical protein
MSYFYQNKKTKSFLIHKSIRDFVKTKLYRFRFDDFLFSGLDPSYEEAFMTEIFNLHNYVGLSLDEINQLPIMDRRWFILKYNEKIDRENAALNGDKTMNYNMDDVKQMSENVKR